MHRSLSPKETLRRALAVPVEGWPTLLRIRCDGREVDSEERFASWMRELTSSLRNTFRRWYSTVLLLINSWAAISGLLAPCATSDARFVPLGA